MLKIDLHKRYRGLLKQFSGNDELKEFLDLCLLERQKEKEKSFCHDGRYPPEQDGIGWIMMQFLFSEKLKEEEKELENL